MPYTCLCQPSILATAAVLYNPAKLLTYIAQNTEVHKAKFGLIGMLEHCGTANNLL